MKTLFYILCIICISFFVDASDQKIKCKCNIIVKDVPAGKNDTVEDAFKNELKIDTCDEKGLTTCKHFCVNTAKEKTDGDLNKESKEAKISYGEILCNKLHTDLDKKTVTMEALLHCEDHSIKRIDTGLLIKDKLTCQNGKFITV